jgi:hypothetical protein
MKVGIKISESEWSESINISEINNPNDEHYALYSISKHVNISEFGEALQKRVGIIDFRDKFLERMINRYK